MEPGTTMADVNETITPEAPGSDAGDSTLGDEIASDTTSIKSWIRQYREENGRTYNSFGDQDYWGPNDEKAQEHLDLAHELFSRTFNGALYLAPLSEPNNVLDVGTGTGLWAIDFAEQNPSAHVVGTDLSPIQPGWVPPNVEFQVDDAGEEWTFPENHFDYIHVRTLYGGIPHWPTFYQRCLRHLKPGGYLEQAEYAASWTSDDGSLTLESPMGRAGPIAHDCFSRLGRVDGELNIFETMKGRITDAGFTDIVEHQYKWPIGTWPKDKKMKQLGVWVKAHLDMGLEGYMMRLLTTLYGWTPEEVYSYCAEIRLQSSDRRCHGIWPMNVVIARKPAL